MKRQLAWLIGIGVIGLGVLIGVVWRWQQGDTLPYTVILEGAGGILTPEGEIKPSPYQEILVFYHPHEVEANFSASLLPQLHPQNFEEVVLVFVQGTTTADGQLEVVSARLMNKDQVIIEADEVPFPRDPGMPSLPALGPTYQVVALDKNQFKGRDITFVLEQEGQRIATFQRAWADLYSPLLITPTPQGVAIVPTPSSPPEPRIAQIAKQWLAFRKGLSRHDFIYRESQQFPTAFPSYPFYLVLLEARFTGEEYRVVVTEQNQPYLLAEVPFRNVPASYPYP